MKNLLNTKTCVAVCCFLIMLVFALPAWSLTIQGNDVGDVDTLIARTNLANSGEGAEKSWVEAILGDDITLSDKIEGDNWNWLQYDADPNIWALELQESPEYYIIKTGKIHSTPDTHFLYTNLDQLSWAVIDLSFDVGLADIDIYKVSHITTFTGVNPVPEPATMLLFGIGLLGIAGLGRKSAKK